MILIREPTKFEWDKGNRNKNLRKHSITDTETEEVLFDNKKRIYKDKLHSDNEERFILLGKTKLNKVLCVVFTLREDRIRIISARPTNAKERRLYQR
jgi:uncharacterized DUF497 family protein